MASRDRHVSDDRQQEVRGGRDADEQCADLDRERGESRPAPARWSPCPGASEHAGGWSRCPSTSRFPWVALARTPSMAIAGRYFRQRGWLRGPCHGSRRPQGAASRRCAPVLATVPRLGCVGRRPYGFAFRDRWWSRIGHERRRTGSDDPGSGDCKKDCDQRKRGLRRTGQHPKSPAILTTDQKVGGSNPSERADVMSRDIGKDPNLHQGSDLFVFRGP